MSRPLPLQNEFKGMRQDYARNRMPPGYAWNLINLIPGYMGPVRDRGGWNTYSNSALFGSKLLGGVYAVFSQTSGPDRRNIAVYSLTSGAMTAASVSAENDLINIGAISVAPSQNPVFHGGTAASAATAVYSGLVIIPQGSSAVAKIYDGVTFQDLGGSPPRTLFAGVYKDYTVLGNGTLSGGGTEYPNRVWFSPPGDPDCAASGAVTAWDTTDSWIDFNDSVFGFGATPNALLVFHRSGVSRIRGSVAPPEGDMVIDHHWYKTDLLDPFSIVEHEGYVYWCSAEGVYRSDGVTVEDLTLRGGMKKYWMNIENLAGEANKSLWDIAAGIHRNRLFISITDGSSEVDSFMVDLNNFDWVRLANITANCFWSGQTGDQVDDLFFGHLGSGAQVMRMDSIFSNDVSVKGVVQDGTSAGHVFFTLETPFYELGRPGLKRMKRVFLGYEKKDYAGFTSPTVSVSAGFEPTEFGDPTYPTFLGNLADTETNAVTATATPGTYDRVVLDVNKRAPGVAFKIASSVSTGDFVLHDLGLEVHYQEESKRT